VKILSKREKRRGVEYRLCWIWDPGAPNDGFAFPCDENGVVDVESLAEPALKNHQACLSGQVDGRPIQGPKLEEDSWSWWEPAVGECEVCQREVQLVSGTNTCECGADYNTFGQRLAPREQWGHETGEHWSDCV